ncbi:MULTISPECIES: glutaminase A [Exiguobacterium]|uniref:Glutaminase n=1 Tax=Exiguobacterium antarcticum TaxID=132920 RepID=A0ABT6R284_9BACL|nr:MULTISPECIES: glutaminase A [Exiguobacterium]MCT4779536.1 glutaminase A [Exiguobacterium soli]MDI3234943.1 glutaminase A [Exiguobacterium antarcticum]OIN66332.1 glutaminase A [Exiguobacterium sp. KRL4]
MNVTQQQLEELIAECRPYTVLGQVASYIPELAKSEPTQLGIAVCNADGTFVSAGDAETMFTLQSVSKIITLAFVLETFGEDYVFSKVGMEPTGDAFNSIAKLEETIPTKPLNPMINAGALAVTSMLPGEDAADKLNRLRQFIADLLDIELDMVKYDAEVAQSEFETTDLNRALLYFMRYHGVIEGNVEEIIDVYTKQCAILTNCKGLAMMGKILSQSGKTPSGHQVISRRNARIIRAIMTTCGMYDASGEFSVQVGLPGKSGVSGAIVACGRSDFDMADLGIGIFGPALDLKGNSIAGTKMLELLVQRHP